MIRNFLSAALRNLVRGRVYSAINIVGLAVGFAAAILIALFIRDEFSYDRWIPEYENVYRIGVVSSTQAQAPRRPGNLDPDFAALIKLQVPSAEAVARLVWAQVALRHGVMEALETVFWADPETLTVLPLPALAGDPKTALKQPDGIVLTRSAAQKYFGRDDPIGEILEINREHRMTVNAVLDDLPSNTHLETGILVSSLAKFSILSELGARPGPADFVKPYIARTYVRLAPGVSAENLRDGLATLSKQHLQNRSLVAEPLADVHLYSGFDIGTADNLNMLYVIAAVGVLIIAVGVMNFVNLTTARAARRAVEVGIRKAVGAGRPNLVCQFLTEAFMYTTSSMIIALTAVEWLLPAFNTFLNRTIDFDYWRDPAALALSLLLIGATAVIGGLYPAFVMSSFRPTTNFRAARLGVGGGSVRRALVMSQFAILIGLIVATTVVRGQLDYAAHDALRLDTDQIVVIDSTKCDGAIRDRIEALPGVRGVACSQSLNLQISVQSPMASGAVPITETSIDFDFFELYGLKPIAGRFFARELSSDAAPGDRNDPRQPPLVINRTAVSALGFASPQEAIGRTIPFPRMMSLQGQSTRANPAEIIGVVADFSLASARFTIQPSAYFVDRTIGTILNIKLSGRDIPETLQAIDRSWNETGNTGPIKRFFMDQHIQDLYLDVTRQAEIFAVLAGIALFVACLGLIGLAGATAERRTKEIGIRKAMGAKTADVLRLLTWEFSKPVLFANLIAWPIAYFLMNRWLAEFAYHIDLSFWIFALAGALAFVIALMTVAVQSFVTARAKPVEALRYE